MAQARDEFMTVTEVAAISLTAVGFSHASR